MPLRKKKGKLILKRNRVTPIYYVIFTTATIIASVILFEGIKRSSAVILSFFFKKKTFSQIHPPSLRNEQVEVATILLGFVTIFIGVFMVNSSKSPNSGTESKAASRHSLHLLTSASQHTQQEIALKPLVESQFVRSAHSEGAEEDEEVVLSASYHHPYTQQPLSP